MVSALIVFYFLVAVSLIILVLLQDPKGDGAIFGGGGSQSLFGATGATSFIVKATRVAAVLFALCVIGLNYTLMGEGSRSAIYNTTDTNLKAPVLETPEEEDTLKAEKEDPAASEVQTDDAESTETAPAESE